MFFEPVRLPPNENSLYLMSPISIVANRKRSKRRKGFQAINFSGALALSTLADDTVLSGGFFTLGEDFFIISMDTLCALRGLTAGEGPIHVGFAHGDLSVGEVEEALQAEVTDPDDIIARERGRRPVRPFGVFPGLNTNEALNDGVPLRKKIKLSIGDGHIPSFYAANRSGAALTTGAIIEFVGTLYGRWQR